MGCLLTTQIRLCSKIASKMTLCRHLPAWLRGAAGALQVLTAETAAAFARCALWLLQPVLVLALRSAVRSRAFWERGLGSAWCALLSCPLEPELCFMGRSAYTRALPACFSHPCKHTAPRR